MVLYTRTSELVKLQDVVGLPAENGVRAHYVSCILTTVDVESSGYGHKYAYKPVTETGITSWRSFDYGHRQPWINASTLDILTKVASHHLRPKECGRFRKGRIGMAKTSTSCA
jgi:hypothetical protein